MKNKLNTRNDEGGNGEEVIVMGNRKDISDPVDNVIEAEFVFLHGELVTVNALQFHRTGMLVFDDGLDDLPFTPLPEPVTDSEFNKQVLGAVEPND